MKALSLKQPWAELVVSGKKTIELRSWDTKFRGKFLVHASLKPDKNWPAIFGFKDLPVGCIVGEVELVDVKTYKNKKEFNNDGPQHFAFGLYYKKVKGFVLKNHKRLKPKPLKGKLGFFEV
jgi:ASCH domain